MRLLQKNNVRAFCMNSLQGGQPLTYKHQADVMGKPVVMLYNGEDFCGVAYETVVAIDLSTTRISPNTVQIGGVINVIQDGPISVEKYLFVNETELLKYEGNHRALPTLYVKPTKHGWWKMQTKKTKKSVACIVFIKEETVEMELLGVIK